MYAHSRHMDDFFIAGMRYWDGSKALPGLEAGKKLKLVPEPDNPADPDAVAVYRKGVKLGYIPRDRNALPALLLRFGHGDALECRVLQVDEDADPWKQVRVGLYVADKRKRKGSA